MYIHGAVGVDNDIIHVGKGGCTCTCTCMYMHVYICTISVDSDFSVVGRDHVCVCV